MEAITVPDLLPFLIRKKSTRHKTEKIAVAIVRTPLWVQYSHEDGNKKEKKKNADVLQFFSLLIVSENNTQLLAHRNRLPSL